MFIINLKYTGTIEAIDQHLIAHRDFLESNYQKGLLLASGPQNPRTGGIIIALGNDRKMVETMIQQDPFFTEKLAEYTITEFTPVKYRAEIKNLVI